MDPLKLLEECEGFEWDDGNQLKNWLNHSVTPVECEEVFFNQPLMVMNSIRDHKDESRYYALGRTRMERRLFIVFTIRGKAIRVISARDMSRKERGVYSET